MGSSHARRTTAHKRSLALSWPRASIPPPIHSSKLLLCRLTHHQACRGTCARTDLSQLNHPRATHKAADYAARNFGARARLLWQHADRPQHVLDCAPDAATDLGEADAQGACYYEGEEDCGGLVLVVGCWLGWWESVGRVDGCLWCWRTARRIGLIKERCVGGNVTWCNMRWYDKRRCDVRGADGCGCWADHGLGRVGGETWGNETDKLNGTWLDLLNMPVPMGDFWASFFLSVVVGRPMFFSFCLLKAWFARFCWGVWRAILECSGALGWT